MNETERSKELIEMIKELQKEFYRHYSGDCELVITYDQATVRVVEISENCLYTR